MPLQIWLGFGSNIEFSKRFQLVADVGFDFEGGYLLVIGPTWRFG